MGNNRTHFMYIAEITKERGKKHYGETVIIPFPDVGILSNMAPIKLKNKPVSSVTSPLSFEDDAGSVQQLKARIRINGDRIMLFILHLIPDYTFPANNWFKYS